MKNYYTLIFGVIWTLFCIIFSYGYLSNDLKFINKNKIVLIAGIIDTTYYVGGGGGESLTIRVKYEVNDNSYYVSAKSMIYFQFEKLIGKKVNVIYLKNTPSISKINTFRERGIPIISLVLFTILGIFIILNSEGLALLRSRKNKTKTNS